MEWQYEPTAFPIAWNRQGEPEQFFAPDFYLPEENNFIEITTMSQKLVTKKNAKVRRLRELYPDITCKILYQRDYLHLVVKYGLEEPANLPDGVPTRIPGKPLVVKLTARGASETK